MIPILICAGLVFSFFIFMFLRQSRIAALRRELQTQLIKASNQNVSKNTPHSRNKNDRAEMMADGAQIIGVAAYNFLSLSEAQKAIQSSAGATESLKEDLVYKALSQRHPDLDTNQLIDKFYGYLDNKTLLKGDVGEQIGAQLHIVEGGKVTLPTALDGTWKSNNEGWDYEVSKGGEVFKENPKVGYDNHFSKLQEQAEKNPDVKYVLGTQHADAVEKSGLENMSVNPALNTENVNSHIEGFKAKVELVQNPDQISDFGVEDSLSLPIFSLALNGARQYSLIKNRDISITEAATNTALKTGMKWGAAKGAGLAGAKIGVMVGGPVGAIIGGAVGAFGGCALGGSVYTAWKSDVVYKGYGNFIYKVERISDVAVGDINCKQTQIKRFQKDISAWISDHTWQVVWPSKEYVMRTETNKFLTVQHQELQTHKNSILMSLPALRQIREKCNKTGFFGRLFGDQKEMEDSVLTKSKTILDTTIKVGIVRVELFKQLADELKTQKETIEREKRKIAA